MKYFTLLITLLIGLSSILSAQTLKENMQINVLISGVPQEEVSRVSSRYLIDAEGVIRLPLLEGMQIKAAGLTGSQLAVKVAEAYKSKGIYSSPILTITTFKDNDAEAAVVAARQRWEGEQERLRLERLAETQVVHVTGYAERTGPQKLTVGMTLQTLLAVCGGDNQFGSERRIQLTRKGKVTELNFHDNPKFLSMPLEAGDFLKIPKGTGFMGKK